MISLDMVAYAGPDPDKARIHGRPTSDPLKVALANAVVDYAGLTPSVEGALDRTDHAPFEWQGFQGAWLAEYNYIEYNPHYHKPTDSVDTPDYIDYEYGAALTRATLGWLVDAAGVKPRCVEVWACSEPLHYGEATPGSAGITPQVSWEGGLPIIGNSDYKLVGTALYGGKTGFLFTGFSRKTVDIGDGCYLNVLPPWIVWSFTVSGLPYPGYGSAEIPVPIPNDPALRGLHFMNFFMCFDEGGPKGLTGTDGLDSGICGL
jgi:hypothetical protein